MVCLKQRLGELYVTNYDYITILTLINKTLMLINTNL